MKRQYLTRVSVAVLFSMFLCSAVQADSLSGLSVITVYDDSINDTLSMTSLTFDGKVYVVADGDLAVGTTTRWDNGTQVVDPAPPALNIGANADNFLFESVINGRRDTNISSLDGLDYQETVFPFLVSTMFVLERGGNDNGTVQAILADGSLGTALTLTGGGAPYANTGVVVRDRNGNGQNAFGYVLTTDVPVKGLRITATGHDTLSISAPNVNFYPANPSPADGATVPVGDVDLSWTNADPNNPDDPVYVDVWFGTDPDPKNGAKVVDAEPNVTSVTVSAPTEGPYYWQVGNYIHGSATGDPCEGDVWSFNAVEDLAPESVNAGVDMITWSGQPVSLDATVVDDGKSALTYAWSADPADGVVFSDPAIEDPTVTITKATANPSTVMLTLAVNDEGNPTPVQDTMDIDVYDDACEAAIGGGLTTYDETDFDANCITDLRDLAVFAAEWLVDNALTAPVPK
jgi:hypothetical protein